MHAKRLESFSSVDGKNLCIILVPLSPVWYFSFEVINFKLFMVDFNRIKLKKKTHFIFKSVLFQKLTTE